jgi:hypothetical protein
MLMRQLLLALVVGWGVIGEGIGAEAWQAVITSTGRGNDSARSVAVDARGDVIAAGTLNVSQLGMGDIIVTKLEGGTGAERWRQGLGFGHACAVALDAAGDVVVAGELSEGSAVFKLEGGTGAERWRQVLGSGHNGDCGAVAVDAAGDVVAAGGLSNNADTDFLVLKLQGGSGVEQWRHVINGSASAHDWASAVAVDPAGDVVAAGQITNAETAGDLLVLKLAGNTGAEHWRQVLNGPANGQDRAWAAVVDAVGDVVAAGVIRNLDTQDDFLVLKLDGGTGAERWRHVIDGPSMWSDFLDGANAVTVDGAGDVVAVGQLSFDSEEAGISTDLFVLKLDGGSGAERWRQTFGDPGLGIESGAAVVTNVAGDVVVAGSVRGDFAVLKLDGGSGAERWHRFVSGTANSGAGASTVVVDAAGDVIAGGSVYNEDTLGDFMVLKLRGTDGGDVGSCRGTGTARLTGRVRTSTGLAGVAGVVLTLSGPHSCRETTTLTSVGGYGFPQLGEGTYTVTPTKAGCTFTPAQREVSLTGLLAGARFEAACE